MRKTFTFATQCWNLALPETDEQAEDLEKFEATVATFPDALAAAVHQRLEARRTKYGQIRLLLAAEIQGTSLDDCKVYAQGHGSAGTQLRKLGSSTD